jgi:hypothetical protein
MQRRYPNLVTGLKYNPLPHSVSVRFRSGLSAKTVMAELRAQHLPGIGVIQSSGC